MNKADRQTLEEARDELRFLRSVIQCSEKLAPPEAIKTGQVIRALSSILTWDEPTCPACGSSERDLAAYMACDSRFHKPPPDLSTNPGEQSREWTLARRTYSEHDPDWPGGSWFLCATETQIERATHRPDMETIRVREVPEGTEGT